MKVVIILILFLIYSKTMAEIDTSWVKSIGEPWSEENGTFIKETKDGDLIIIGYYMNSIFLKTDKNGNLKVIKHYGGSVGFDSDAHQMIESKDNKYYIIGSKKKTNEDFNKNIWLLC
ncbi:MAG: hypothetical protein Q8S01_13270, partial [Ignavibacteria bacterium]|nr:hypothetical protein [Ignavibacteria bacterium]